ncbi:NifU-like protein [Ostertagia ostertagi]
MHRSRGLIRGFLNAGRVPRFSAMRSLFIQMQETPNPLSLKFLPGQAILDEPRTYEFTSVASAKDSPLARELFHINGVRSVFLGEDFITITKKDEETDWALMRAEILSAITNFIESGKPIITEGGSSPAYEDTVIHEDDDDTVAMIKELLDSRVRPMVQEDGGDVTYMGFTDGVVKLKLKVKEVIEVTDEADDLVQKELEKFEKSHGITD